MQSYCTFALLFTSLLSNEYFILLQTLLRAVERNVQTSMRSMNFARRHTALEVSTTNVQWFAVRLVSSRHGTGRNVAAARMHPREAATREYLNTNSNVNFIPISYPWLLLLTSNWCFGISWPLKLTYATCLLGITLAGSWSPSWKARPT